MNIFEEVKELVDVPTTARHYGVEVHRGNMAICPFHHERTPSCKLYDKNYHCFSCQAHGDVIKLVQELFGNCIITGNFQRIENDRFFRYNLQNKLLMVDDDMQMSALPSTGYIKNLVTAEIPIDVEAKGKQSEQSLLYTRLLCLGNGSPKALYDKSKGFSRRMIILTALPPPEDRVNDPNIAKKFIAEKEKIFCWMFDGLQRLIRNKYHFTISEKAKLNVKEAVHDSCNIPEFLSDTDRVIFGEKHSVTSSMLYSSYYGWCEDNALTQLKRDTFTSWMKQHESELKITYSNNAPYNSKKVRGFKGIGLKQNGFSGV